MLRRLIAAAMLTLPSLVSAQYLQNITTATHSLRTTLTKESDTRYLYSVQFRNEAPFESNRVFAITDISINNFGGMTPYGPRSESMIGDGLLGNVFTGQVDAVVPGALPLAYRANWFEGGSSSGQSSRWGGSSTSTSVLDGWGLLGCGVPQFDWRIVNGLNHAGNTCALAGFTGWVTMNFAVTFYDPTPNYMGSELTANVYGFYVDRAAVAVNVVPEPATWAMMALGLGIMAVARRRRVL